MTLVQKFAHFVELWAVAVPHVATQSIQDVSHWCEFDARVIEKAILRTGRRFAAGKLHPGFVPEEAFRYVSAIARAESKKQARPANAARAGHYLEPR